MADEHLTELSIKNMVCPRCELVVKQTLEELGINVLQVELGRAVMENVDGVSSAEIDEALKEHGFELLKGKNQKLVEQIKTLLIRYVQKIEDADEVPKVSDYLTEHLNQDYSFISSMFSQSEGITVEKYVIHLKIERARELLSYEELTLSEIAWKLNYSSVAYLSSQFKQIAGMTVTDYKKARYSFRRSLDEIKK